MKKTNKLISILLVLAMMLTMAPISAFAADCVAWNDPNVNGVIDSDESEFASLSEAFTAVLNGTATYIRLNSDASFRDWIEISDKEFTVDMNGYELHNNYGSFDLSGSAKMTVTDTGETLGAYTSSDFLAYVSGNATLIIEKGNYKNFLVDCWDNSNIIINGGTIDAQVCIGSNLEVNGDAKFVRSIEFSDGFCDFSDYENIKDIKLYVSSQNVSNFSVAEYFALPNGMAFYDAGGNAVDTLEAEKEYTIKETATAPAAHAINITDTVGGTVTANYASAISGARVSLYVKPDTGYSFNRTMIDIKDAGGNKVEYSQTSSSFWFIMPDSDIKITVNFFSKHTHSFEYTASGDTITAVCENTDGNCSDSEGTLTIYAPADLYADGTTAKEATVENNLVDTSVVIGDITYSTFDGKAPKTAGTYTASVTVGGATATVEYTLVKRNAAADMFVFSAPANLVYDGTAKYATVKVSPEITGMGAITVSYYQNGEAVEPINAGTYTVKVSTAESDKYYAINDVELASFTIEKKAVTAIATVPDKIYDGTINLDLSKVVIEFDGVADDDSIEYEVLGGSYFKADAGKNINVAVSYDVDEASAKNYDFEYEMVTIPESNHSVMTKANILPRDISNAEITLGDALTYKGEEQEQTIASVTVDGLEVTYSVSGNKATNVGVYPLTVTGTGNFTGEAKTALYTINPDLSGIEGLYQYNVKSTNKADIEYVYNQLVNAETDLASADKKAEWEEIKDDCWQWLKILESVAYRVESLGNSYLAYDINTVTSADDEALLSLEAEMYLFMRDYGDNMTEEELDILDNAWVEIANLRDRIAETTKEYNRINALANGYDEATVTSADKDDLIQLSDDIYALALTDNVTADEKTSLMNSHINVFTCIQRITYVSNEIKQIIEAVDKYVFESVKSDDKADIEQLITDIRNLTDTQNITADERTLLDGADETCDKLIAKIDETVAEINRINDATNAYDIDTVTSADKADIEKLIADIKVLTDGDNITDTEREQLIGNDSTLGALLERINATADEIERIENAVNGYDEATVKSTDKADLEKLIEDIKALTDATNITDDERANLEALDATADALIKKIDDTKAEIDRINEAVNGYDTETVKSSDIPALGKLIEDIKALTDGDNITEDERAALEADDAAVDALIEKLAEVAKEINRVDEAVKSYDENTVKSTDKEDLAQLKEDVQALIDSTNTTENEKTALGEMVEKIEALEDKIEEIEQQLEKIADIENGYNPETVTSDDKAAIEETIAEIEAVNPDNLTDEQKAEYDEIKAELETLLDEIAAAGAEVDAIGVKMEMFDKDRVTIFWEDDIEAVIAEIDTLLEDTNMGTAEIEKLNEYKAQAEELIEIINNPKEYISCRFFYFIWDCLNWKWNGILWLFSKIFGYLGIAC